MFSLLRGLLPPFWTPHMTRWRTLLTGTHAVFADAAELCLDPNHATRHATAPAVAGPPGAINGGDANRDRYVRPHRGSGGPLLGGADRTFAAQFSHRRGFDAAAGRQGPR